MRRTATALLTITACAAVMAADPNLAPAVADPLDACTPHTLGPTLLDVPSVAISPEFRLNGHPFPGVEAGIALFTLWASERNGPVDGPQLVLWESHSAPQTVRVIPGVYDIYYSWMNGSGVPRNQLTRVLEGVTLDRDRSLVVDVPMIRVSGVKQHNGNPFGFDGSATFNLRGVDRPGDVPLGAAQPPEFDVAILPGVYDAEYDWQQGVDLPNNRHAAFRRLELLASARGLVLDVPSVIQSFAFLHNGGSFPGTAFDRGNVVLRRGDREHVLAGSSHESGGTVRLIPGSYDVHWQHVVGSGVPNNTDARILRGLAATGGLRVIDVPSLEVSGSFFVNGEPTPNSEFENARLQLVMPKSDDTVVLGQTRFGGYLKRIVPGTYDLVYEHVIGASVLPVNPRATIARGWRVEQSPTRNIDIPAGTYQGTLLWNGGDFPVSDFNSGDIYAISDSAGEYPVLLGRTKHGGFDKPLLPGRYQAGYAHDVGSGVPQNTFGTFGPTRRIVNGTVTSGSLDVLSGPLEVTYRHNGVVMPAGGVQNMVVHLARGLNHLRLPESIDGPRVIEAMEGRFDLFYEFRGGPDLPRNAFMRMGCWTLTR